MINVTHAKEKVYHGNKKLDKNQEIKINITLRRLEFLLEVAGQGSRLVVIAGSLMPAWLLAAHTADCKGQDPALKVSWVLKL